LDDLPFHHVSVLPSAAAHAPPLELPSGTLPLAPVTKQRN
jgi:hypothetical protein